MKPAIAYCFDASFLMPLAVSLRSVLENWSGPTPSVHLIHSDLPIGARELLTRAIPSYVPVDLHWHSAPEWQLKALPVGLHFSKANYFRLLLPKILANEEVVLYLDADTLAVANLNPVYSAFSPSYPLQACQDYLGCFGNSLAHLKNLEQFGISPQAKYFNSGVLLMNLARWRMECLSERIIQFGEEHPETLFFADQSAINIVLHGRIGELAPEWNCQLVHPKVLSREWDVPYLPQNSERAKILHYTTEFKPWSYGKDLPIAQAFHSVWARLGVEF